MAAVTKVARTIGKLSPETTAFLLCDIQEKFQPSIKCFDVVCDVAKRMVKAAELLDIPVIATEQYPKGLGHIVADIDTSGMKVFEKTLFSMKTPEVMEYLTSVRPNLKSVVIFGIEAHVCVQQTTLDFLEEGYDVHLTADGISSRTITDRAFAVDRMRQSGGFITTHESILFMLLKDAKHPKFRDVQKLIMTSLPDQVAKL